MGVVREDRPVPAGDVHGDQRGGGAVKGDEELLADGRNLFVGNQTYYQKGQ